MFEPVKTAWGEYMQRFYDDVVASTKPLREFKTRGFGYCFAYAPSRMVDQAELMLATWQKNDTTGKPTSPSKLPVVITAFAKDYAPTGRDYSFQVSDALGVSIPTDDKERYFKVKTIAGDLRVQIAIFAADEASAKSIAAQLLLFVDSPTNRGFDAIYEFAGEKVAFPCQIEMPDMPASNIETGNKNLTILVVDFTLHCTVPIYDAPASNEPNDGKGTNDDSDPNGYPLVREVHQKDETTPTNGRDVIVDESTRSE